MAVLKSLVIFEQGVLHFSFCTEPCKFVASPGAKEKSLGFFLKDENILLKDFKQRRT